MLTADQRYSIDQIKLQMLYQRLRDLESSMIVANYFELLPAVLSIKEQIKRIENE